MHKANTCHEYVYSVHSTVNGKACCQSPVAPLTWCSACQTRLPPLDADVRFGRDIRHGGALVYFHRCDGRRARGQRPGVAHHIDQNSSIHHHLSMRRNDGCLFPSQASPPWPSHCEYADTNNSRLTPVSCPFISDCGSGAVSFQARIGIPKSALLHSPCRTSSHLPLDLKESTRHMGVQQSK